jgi:hypoxanthine phosphoribosyltransferase
MSMVDDVAEVLVSQADIQRRVKELGAEIAAAYEGKNPLLVGVLKGSFMFMADLIRAIPTPVEVDFIATSAYGMDTKYSGVVRILMDLASNIEGRHVLVVEDIVDTGWTLHYITQNLRTRGPADVRICALLDKPYRREVEIPLDFVGFTVKDVFVVGYGIDYAQGYRNLPFVGVLKPELYRKPTRG